MPTWWSKSRWAALVAPELERQEGLALPASFRDELERQCNVLAPFVLVMGLWLWLPYVPVHRRVYPAHALLVANDYGLSVVCAVLLALRATTQLRRRGLALISVLLTYVAVAGGVTTALVGADASYLAGFGNILFTIPLLPLPRSRSLGLLALAVGSCAVAIPFSDSRFDTPIRAFDLMNVANAVIIAGVAIFLLDWLRKQSHARAGLLDRERRRSEDLLLNVLPAPVAEELKTKGAVAPVHFDEVSVLFTDFVGFTSIAEKLGPVELTRKLDEVFERFDEIVEKHGLEKLKTIGDSYMCAGGLPNPNRTHASDCIRAGLEMQQCARDFSSGGDQWQLRLGVHTGPAVAGVIGKRKFAYDVWGDTVNVASRMESSGVPGEVNVSARTREAAVDDFEFEARGPIAVKHGGTFEMFLVRGTQSHD